MNVRQAAERLLLGALVIFGGVALFGLFVTHVLVHTELARMDVRGDTWLAAHRSPDLNTATHWFTLLAETLTVTVLAVVAVAGVALAARRWREPLFLALAVGGEVQLFLAVTLVVHRHRPLVSHLDPAPPTSSYPSGHTAAAIALYGGVAILAARLITNLVIRRVLVVIAFFVPAVVAFSRIYRGMHFPTDVIGGIVLGCAWLGVLTAVLLPQRSHTRVDVRR